jgi:hypothetical protein
MRYLVAVPLDGADHIVMEIDGDIEGGVVRSARPGEVVATVAESFDAALDRLRPLTRAIVARLRDVTEGPGEVSVEFGFKMSLEAGMIVARSASEANFAVTLRWNRA